MVSILLKVTDANNFVACQTHQQRFTATVTDERACKVLQELTAVASGGTLEC
jgi:hypothetical protein